MLACCGKRCSSKGVKQNYRNKRVCRPRRGNREGDVRSVQQLLNGVLPEDGGPRPVLEEDGKCGHNTRDAIKSFQIKQFPGSNPDSRVDPQKKTIQRLNERSTRYRGNKEVSQNEYLELARALVPEAVRRVHIARNRLANALRTYQQPSSKIVDNSRKLVAWHFKTHRIPDPIAAIRSVDEIYVRMSTVLQSHLSGKRQLFDVGHEYSYDYAALYTSMGTWNAPDSKLSDNGERENQIRVVSKHGPGTIIHELGHMCGGENPLLDSIGHIANPVPPPYGSRLEEGTLFHNYRSMTFEEAKRNCASYQALSEPDPTPFGPALGTEEW